MATDMYDTYDTHDTYHIHDSYSYTHDAWAKIATATYDIYDVLYTG